LDVITQLKHEIEAKIGARVTDRGHCQQLSDTIHEELGETLSYNTIRRFFGLAKGSGQSKATLNILSRFVGYESYQKFFNAFPFEAKWSFDNNMYMLLDQLDEDELINFLIKLRLQDHNFLLVFIQICRELLMLGQVSLIDAIFKSKELRINRFSFSEMIQIGNSLGILFRRVQFSEEQLIKLLNNSNFVEFALLTFVDYSNLSTQYGAIIALGASARVKLKKNVEIFFQCTNYFRKTLMCTHVDAAPLEFARNKHQHPILIGRIAAVEIHHRHQQAKAYSDVLATLQVKIDEAKSNKIDYLYEIKTISLLLKAFDVMEWLQQFSRLQSSEEYYHVSHIQLLYITQMILSISQDDLRAAHKYHGQIDKKKWVLCYYDFFDLFNCIGLYHLTQDDVRKEAVLKDYVQLAKKLNYPLFTKSFALNYFL
jgi:hypothetical protein